MSNIGEYNKRKVVTVEKSSIEDLDNQSASTENILNEQEVTEFSEWMKSSLGDKLKEVKVKRLIFFIEVFILKFQILNR